MTTASSVLPTRTAAAPGGPLLSLDHVSKRFETTRHKTAALQEATLDVRAGEFICIVGPSGCGKSTLLNLISGLDHADSGRVLFRGEEITGPGPDRVLVFQEAALFPWLNVRGNVEFGLKMKGVDRRARREATDRFLDLVGLRRFEKAYFHELSGGMRQRVQLARALAVEPAMLLMDEPFAALDAQTRDVLQLEVQQIWARLGTTIIFITHNVREAVILADRVLVMSPSPGRIKREFAIDLDHPRGPDDHAVVDLAAAVRAELQHDIRTGESNGD